MWWVGEDVMADFFWNQNRTSDFFEKFFDQNFFLAIRFSRNIAHSTRLGETDFMIFLIFLGGIDRVPEL